MEKSCRKYAPKVSPDLYAMCFRLVANTLNTGNSFENKKF